MWTLCTLYVWCRICAIRCDPPASCAASGSSWCMPSLSLGLPVHGNVPGKPGDIPGPPGIFPPETRNVPLTLLSSDPSGISPAGGNIPSPIGNITGPSGISSAHRENHRPAGWGISPARSGASPAGGNIPSPIGNITGRPPLPLRPAENILMPKPPLGISPAGGGISPAR